MKWSYSYTCGQEIYWLSTIIIGVAAGINPLSY